MLTEESKQDIRKLVIENFIKGGTLVRNDFIAYILGKYGAFNAIEFNLFVSHPLMKAQYHHFWNMASLNNAGFTGRIN